MNKKIVGLMLAVSGGVLAACAAAPGVASADQPVAAATSESAAHAAQTEATRKVAMAFLDRYFIEHNFGAYAEFADPNFIQHNPKIADGVAGHRAYFAKMFGGPKPEPAPPPQAHVIDLVLVDGDVFSVMHHAVNGDGTGRIFVDLWRVKDGKIAEHWDVIQDMPLDSAMPHRNGMGCGYQTYAAAIARKDSVVAPACGVPDPKVNRETSLRNYRDYVGGIAKGDILAAIDEWFHPDYKQHSPIIADGKQGAIDYLKEEWGKPNAPKPVLGPQRVVAEGDYVLVHYMYSLEGLPTKEAHIDIFKFKDGKIIEHWDVKQKVPDHAENQNGMW